MPSRRTRQGNRNAKKDDAKQKDDVQRRKSRGKLCQRGGDSRAIRKVKENYAKQSVEAQQKKSKGRAQEK